MNPELEYNMVYDLRIDGEDYKGIYLGKRIPRSKRPKSRHVILVNKSADKLSLHSYSLIAFNKYKFNESNKLILGNTNYLIPTSNLRGYLEELCQKLG